MADTYTVVNQQRGRCLDVAGVSTTDGAAPDSFCPGTSCVITVVYDQSGRGTDLSYQGVQCRARLATEQPGHTSRAAGAMPGACRGPPPTVVAASP